LRNRTGVAVALTNAERQAGYRARQLNDAGERLDMVVPSMAKVQLGRLARHHGIPLRLVLAKLVAGAERDVIAPMSNKQLEAYYAD
jgi:hypothetical protein